VRDVLRTAPHDEGELVARARAIAGQTVAELARAHAVALPPDTRRHKGVIGALVEKALGATARARAVPDFEALGVELKTIPVGRNGKPRESTFVCSIPLARIAEERWATSTLRTKLARVLWVPIESEAGVPLAARRIGAALLWSPSLDEEAGLRADWEELAGRLGRGEAEPLRAHAGRWLQVRPKAASSAVRRRAFDEDGAPVVANPRGFYLRASFTARLFGG
jgi:DNA mismatch repair protein MutH